MARFGSPELEGALTGPVDHHFVADLFYNGERRIAGLPISEPRFREDAGGKVQHTGSCTVVWSDEFASSLSPAFLNDPLAPFGARLVVYSVVSVGPFVERVLFGTFEITDVPSARDEQFRFRGRWLTAGSVVELELKDTSYGVSQESFDAPSSPSDLGSTWRELGVLSGFPLVRNADDVPISRSVLYPDSKLDAVYDLCRVMLDAVPHVMASGALTVRPNVWPAPVSVLRRGGGLVSVSGGMSAAEVYNRVVVRAAGGSPAVLAVAEVTSGPLRVRNSDGSPSPFRTRTKYLSSEFVTTVDQAQVWADSTLRQVSVLRSRVVTVVETFNPLRERGDVVDIERPTVMLHGRVLTISRDGGATQTLTVEVAGESKRSDVVIPPWPSPFGLYPSVGLFPSEFLYPLP